MPHPRFKHQWEEDSYWKHYENYQEELAIREENKKAEAEAEAIKNKSHAKSEAVKADAESAKAQAKDGWQTIFKR